MANPSVTYTFSNGTAADASEVNTNFSDIINSLTDGTKSLSIDALTAAGAATFNGNVTLGNASGDTITVTGTPTFGAVDVTFDTDTLFVDATNDRVGINTTSPAADFEIQSGASNTEPIVIMGENGNNKVFRVLNNPGQEGVLNLFDGGTSVIQLHVNGTSYINNTSGFGIGTTSPDGMCEAEDTSTTTNNTFFRTTGPTMTAGNLHYGMQCTKSGGSMAILGYAQHASSGNDAGFLMLEANDGVDVWLHVDTSNALRISGAATNIGADAGTVVGDQTSDERLKENIADCPYGLNEVLKLKPIRYILKGQEAIGFGAQTTQKIIPEAVYDTQEKIDDSNVGKLAMKGERIIPVLVNAIKELSKKVEELEAKL